MNSSNYIIDDILVTLRKIIRAVDLYSKQLIQLCGLTVPQLITLREIERFGEVSLSELSNKVSLSNSTVTGIVDRLELKGFISRVRNNTDKRRILIKITDSGKDILEKSPKPFQDAFAIELDKLKEWEKTQLLSSLQRIATMMEAERIEAKPILVSGSLNVSVEKADKFLEDIK